MEPKLRVFEIAKELNVDSTVVMEVLQTLNVDVKNHMSTVDQDTAQKVTKAVKRTPAKKAAAGAVEVAKVTPAEAPKPARDANPAKSSLLSDFFGASTKPRQSIEDMKRELRPAGERPLSERRPLTERHSMSELSRPAGAPERPVAAPERPTAAPERPVSERPAAAQRPVSERPAAAQRPVSERPAAAQRPVSERPAAAVRPLSERSAGVQRSTAERPATASAKVTPPPAEQPPAAVAEVNEAEAAPVAEKAPSAAAPAPEPLAEAFVAPPEIEAPPEPADHPGEPANEGADPPDTDDHQPVRSTLAGPARLIPGAPAAAGPRIGGPGLPRPAGAIPSAGTSSIGMPSRPLPPGPAADRTGMESGPRRPLPPGPMAASAPSGLGLPSRPIPGAPGLDRPRPAGAGGFGPRPGGAGARPGGSPFGPRPGTFGARQPRGGPLTIPKVDPKVAEAAKPGEGKKPIGQGGDRKKGDAFTKRETAASRPSEEKLFGRRPGMHRSSVVERRSLKPITIGGSVTVKDLAHEMGVTAGEVIKKLLTGFGIMATINQELDSDTCILIAGEFGVEATLEATPNLIEEYDQVTDLEEVEELKETRHPVVTIMGHVDHGKTSLLDAIRQTRVAVGEAGGITQHIGAYEVDLHGRKITFLDTPGHEAFTAMRARGANVTDIAILVVAADDSVMPQTIESINHARAANVPVLVAINKVDKPGADPQRVKQDLTAHGLVAEEWGGETIMVPVSAKQKENIDLLLENILILADVQDLKANPNKEARGTILEAELDKARGPVATVLVQQGTLQNGDTFVAGSAWGRVRAMFDHRGKKLKVAGPSTPVRILGFNAVPAAGDVFRVTPDEKLARDVAERRVAKVQSERQGTKAMSLDDFMSKVKEGEVKDLNLVVKADVQGSVEALRGQLEKLRNDEVQVKLIHSAVGAITESDVMLAYTSKAIIIGFSVRPDERAARAASEQGVDIRSYDVIYNVVDDMKAAMTGMLAPRIEEMILGRAEVRETFKVPKVGVAAGCMVVNGKVTRNARYRLIRDGVVVWTGEINALRRFKDEVRDVAEGYECGITLEKFQDFKPGDLLEAFELKEVKAS